MAPSVCTVAPLLKWASVLALGGALALGFGVLGWGFRVLALVLGFGVGVCFFGFGLLDLCSSGGRFTAPQSIASSAFGLPNKFIAGGASQVVHCTVQLDSSRTAASGPRGSLHLTGQCGGAAPVSHGEQSSLC